MRRAILLLSVCLTIALGSTPTAQSDSTTTAIFVRHAERESSDADSPLSAKGRERAEVLAEVLRDSGIKTIVTSDTIRTRETAAPFARRAGLTPEVLPARDLDAVVNRIRALKSGALLVVHHSNTVPALVEKLGGKIPPIEDQEFDRLIVMTLPASGGSSVLTLRYGPLPAR